MTNRLPTKVRIAYGAGDFGFSAASTIVSFFLLFYLSDVVKIDPGWAGTALLAAKLWDAIIDPFIGNLSDKTKTKWGKRRPFFLFLAVPFGFTFFLMWTIPVITDASMLATLIIVIAAYMLHITFYSGMHVPYSSLTAELTDDYDERTSLTAWRMAFSIVAGLLGAVIPTLIVGMFERPLDGYAAMGAVIGILISFSPLAVFFGCREKETNIQKEKQLSFPESIRMTFKNKPFILALTMFLLTWVAIDMVSAVLLFYLKYVLDMEASSEIILGLLFIVATVFLPFWVWFSKKYGKKQAYIFGLGLFVLALLMISFLNKGMEAATYTLATFAGIGLSAAHVIPYSIIPDCIEYDEMKTGEKRAGAYYGVVSFLLQLSASIGAFITGNVLKWSGYIADGVQPVSALYAMRFLLGVVPLIMIIGAIFSMLNYRIGRRQHEIIKKAVAREQRISHSIS
ncbi:MAG: MFS transporter [Eubacteriales bacterium]|nr:MFS transporter [Eubacteriales bacterium]